MCQVVVMYALKSIVLKNKKLRFFLGFRNSISVIGDRLTKSNSSTLTLTPCFLHLKVVCSGLLRFAL